MEIIRSKLPYVLLFSLALGLTLASLSYVQPAECQRICDDPVQAPCPPGSCRIGEQRAGFPLFFVVDRGGSSPTGGWGKVGPEDMPDPISFLLNVAIYAILLRAAWEGLQVIQGKKRPRALLTHAPLLVLALAVMLYGYYSGDHSSEWNEADYSTPQGAILGNWKSTDAGDGTEFIFRFYDSKQWSIVFPGGEKPDYWGDYSWVEDGMLQIAYHGMGSPGSGICTTMINFLQEYCNTKVVDPSAYPEPAIQVNLAYPIPTREPVEFKELEAKFEVEITVERMSLIRASGTSVVFQRVVEN